MREEFTSIVEVEGADVTLGAMSPAFQVGIEGRHELAHYLGGIGLLLEEVHELVACVVVDEDEGVLEESDGAHLEGTHKVAVDQSSCV